jgi:hypothetical protein
MYAWSDSFLAFVHEIILWLNQKPHPAMLASVEWAGCNSLQADFPVQSQITYFRPRFVPDGFGCACGHAVD